MISITYKQNIICSRTHVDVHMSRPLFVGSYLQVIWWPLSQWERRKNAVNDYYFKYKYCRCCCIFTSSWILEYDLNPAWTFSFKCFFFVFLKTCGKDMMQPSTRFGLQVPLKVSQFQIHFCWSIGSELTHHIVLSKYYHSLYQRNFTTIDLPNKRWFQCTYLMLSPFIERTLMYT